MALLLRVVVRVVTAQSEHLFYKKANVPEATQPGFEEALGGWPSCVPDERKNSNVN
jgi:hypothetical protein